MYLYRYRDLGKYTEDILQNNRLYYTNPTAFNDPFDCSLPLDLSASKTDYEEMIADAARRVGLDPIIAVKKAKTAKPHSNTSMQSKIAAFAGNILKESSLCCFSPIGHNILMFSHYADSHRGICLQFSPDACARLGPSLPVIYRNTYPELRYVKLRNRGGELVKSLFLSKYSDWAYEQERRVVRLQSPAGFVSFLPSDLIGLIFGCKTTNADVGKVSQWLRKGGAKPAFYKAHVSHSKFELEVKPI